MCENVVNTKTESDQLNELFAALAKAQAEIEIAKTDSANPFFKSKYADFAQIVKASRPYLAKNGLAVIQRVLSNGNDKMYLYTRLCHASGQWIESKMPISPAKGDIQSIGSYITYLKRYNWAAIVGVAASDEDDDGESAMDRRDEKVKEIEKITPGQIRELEKLLFDLSEDDEKAMLTWCQVEELNQIPQNKFASVKKALEKKLEVKKGDK